MNGRCLSSQVLLSTVYAHKLAAEIAAVRTRTDRTQCFPRSLKPPSRRLYAHKLGRSPINVTPPITALESLTDRNTSCRVGN